MIVVQLFAAQPDRDRRDIPALVFDIEVPISDGVSDSIDDSSGPEWNPYHLDAPNQWADKESEQINVDAHHDDDAKPVERRKQMPLEPVVGRALAVLIEDSRLANSLSIVERAFENDVPQALHQGAVRVTLAVRESVMLPMARDPLFGDDRGRKPQPNAHWKRGEVMKLDSAMGLRPMQEQSNGHIREVSGNDDEQHWLPPR